MNTRKHNTRRLLVLAYSNSCKCSDLGVPAPYGRNIAPTRVYHRLGRLIGESQERVARAKPLPGDVGVSSTTKIPFLLASRREPGDEVDQLVELKMTP